MKCRKKIAWSKLKSVEGGRGNPKTRRKGKKERREERGGRGAKEGTSVVGEDADRSLGVS